MARQFEVKRSSIPTCFGGRSQGPLLNLGQPERDKNKSVEGCISVIDVERVGFGRLGLQAVRAYELSNMLLMP